jgi:hypothetical protein
LPIANEVASDCSAAKLTAMSARSAALQNANQISSAQTLPDAADIAVAHWPKTLFALNLDVAIQRQVPV